MEALKKGEQEEAERARLQLEAQNKKLADRKSKQAAPPSTPRASRIYKSKNKLEKKIEDVKSSEVSFFGSTADDSSAKKNDSSAGS